MPVREVADLSFHDHCRQFVLANVSATGEPSGAPEEDLDENSESHTLPLSLTLSLSPSFALRF